MIDSRTDPRTPHVIGREPFTVRRLVRWGDSDPAGIIYTGAYLDYMVETAEDFFVDLTGVHWREMQNRDGTGTPMVHASMDFQKPVEAGRPIDIALHLGEVGQSSFHLHFVSRDEAGDVCFTGKLIGVFIRHDGPGKIRANGVPADWRPLMERYSEAWPPPQL
ncbi:MAG: acyl-CoA thioesterase [Minwuia sp.]|uniref:acyl-CoA thioesterase n=1 Tax=Minwuia sp. TaxID=2493630 RepID=UPI003A84E865